MRKEEKLWIIAAGILGIVFIILLPENFKGKNSVFASGEEKSASSTEKTERPARNFLRLEEETKNLQVGRDPFFNSTDKRSQRAKRQKLILNEIAWDNQFPTAVVNNIIVNVGSVIEDKTVIEIRKDRVILTDGKKNFELVTGL